MFGRLASRRLVAIIAAHCWLVSSALSLQASKAPRSSCDSAILSQFVWQGGRATCYEADGFRSAQDNHVGVAPRSVD